MDIGLVCRGGGGEGGSHGRSRIQEIQELHLRNEINLHHFSVHADACV